MKKLLLVILVFSSLYSQGQRLLVNGQKFIASYDSDAQAYFDAAGGLSTTEKNAWNTFVTSAKSHSYWSKIYVINPVLGSSSAQHAVNAKNPGTYDATYNGTITHTSQHMVGNGTTGYVNTGFNMNGGDADGYATIAVWVRNAVQGTYPVMGAISSTNKYVQIYPWFGNTLYGQVNTDNSITENQTSIFTSVGLSLATRTASTSAYIQRNATQYTGFTTSTSIVNNNIYVLAQNNGGSAAFFTTYQVCMYLIADAFTTTNASDFYTDMNTFITAVGR